MRDNNAHRQPRLRLIANGALIAGVIEVELSSNNHYAADRFRAAIAVGAGRSIDWSQAPSIFCDFQMSINGGQSWTSLVQGAVDTVDIDAVVGVVNVSGRDLTAGLIETRTQETFENQTSSNIARLLAERHGLSSDVKNTSTPVGRYWQLGHDQVTLDQFSRATTEWDLLVTLAQREGFDVWVSGNTLHFRPQSENGAVAVVLRPTATAYGEANVVTLRLERSLTLARDIEVVIKSWNSRQQTAFIQTARSTRGGDSPRSGRKSKPQRYVYVVPNLGLDEALKLAQRRLAELSRHERVISAEMPGELALAPRMQLRLEGTGTDFDQIYWIDEIDRSLHVARGFTQHVRARNASVGSQATTPADRPGHELPSQ